jgi:CHAD domain-containing protein
VLRRLARALGAVRDIDVLRMNTEKYAEQAEPEVRTGLAPLHATWERTQPETRAELCTLLDSETYERFLVSFAHFVNTPGWHALSLPAEVTEPMPMLVRHVVPRVIYEKFEAVRAYEPILATASFDALHALRIKAKQLRYALEAFEELLTPDAHTVIMATKALQDHLGELQDARVAEDMMHDFLTNVDDTQTMTTIQHYLAARQAEKHKLHGEVAPVWAAFTRLEIRKAMAAAIAEL